MTQKISVVLVAFRDYAHIARTVGFLSRQTVADQIELIIVAPHRLPELATLTGFGAVQVVEIGRIHNVDIAAADGVLAATAPIVSVIEDHAYPDPAWAERIIATYAQGDWGIVGSRIGNANPASGLSWANMLIAYGPQSRTKRQEVKNMPTHNSSFRTALVQAYGDDLRAMMGRGGGLMAALREQGATAFHAGDARVAHANPSKLSASADLRFNAGRQYATKRAQDWSLSKRIGFALGAPLIPFVRLLRFYQDYFASGAVDKRVLPALLLALSFDAVGQAAGYLWGEGKSAETLATFEMGRLRHLTPHDSEALA